MQEEWIGYELELEDGFGTCLINVGLAEIAPDAKRPCCALLRIPFHDPGNEGLGEQSERDAILRIEDTINDRISSLDAIHFATVRGGGAIDMWFYLAENAQEELEAIAMSASQGYASEFGANPDPEWEEYKSLYPSPESIAAYSDAQVIDALREAGDRLDIERPVDHIVYAPDITQANKIVRSAEMLGFRLSDQSESEGELPLRLSFTKRQTINRQVIAETRAALTEIAEEMGGAYDGWESPLVK